MERGEKVIFFGREFLLTRAGTAGESYRIRPSGIRGLVRRFGNLLIIDHGGGYLSLAEIMKVY